MSKIFKVENSACIEYNFLHLDNIYHMDEYDKCTTKFRPLVNWRINDIEKRRNSNYTRSYLNKIYEYDDIIKYDGPCIIDGVHKIYAGFWGYGLFILLCIQI